MTRLARTSGSSDDFLGQLGTDCKIDIASYLAIRTRTRVDPSQIPRTNRHKHYIAIQDVQSKTHIFVPSNYVLTRAVKENRSTVCHSSANTTFPNEQQQLLYQPIFYLLLDNSVGEATLCLLTKLTKYTTKRSRVTS